MPDRRPREIDRKVVYDGHKVRLEVHRIEAPDGRQATREVVRHGGSVAVLAFGRGADGGRDVLLERNYRYTVDRYLVEIPAGTLDRGEESPEACARRELEEETGFRAAKLEELFTVLPSPGFLDERLTVFAAEDVTSGEAAPEAGELIEVLWIPWPEALRMVRENEIEDGKTIAAILYYEALRSGAAIV